MTELTWEQIQQILSNQRPTQQLKQKQTLTIKQVSIKQKTTPQTWKKFSKK